MSLQWRREPSSGLWWPCVKYDSTMEAYSAVAKNSQQWMRKALKEVALGQPTPVVHSLAFDEEQALTELTASMELRDFSTDFMDCMSHNTRLVAALDAPTQSQFRQACGLAEGWMPSSPQAPAASNETTVLEHQSPSTAPSLAPSTFAQLVQRLSKQGWTVVAGCGHPNLYVQPRKTMQTGVKGVDYFDTDDSLKEYCRQHHAWAETSTRRASLAPTYRTPNHPTRPQDPMKPLLADEPEDEEVEDDLTWTVLWKNLTIARWKKVRAWDRQRGHYYLRPGVPEQSGTLGVDYFDSPSAVMKHVKWRHGGATLFDGLSQELAAEETETKATTTATSSSKKKNKATTNKKENTKNSRKRKTVQHVTPTPVAKRATRGALQPALQSNQKIANDFWWKKQLPPSFDDDVWPLLQRLGYATARGIYQIPGVDGAFSSATGLAKFVASYGLPGFTENKFTPTENKTLDRWRRFVNVPPVANPRALCKVGGAVEWDEAVLLARTMGLHVIDGKIFDPNMDKSGRVSGRKRGIHYYEAGDHNHAFRVFLRDRWIVDDEVQLGENPDYVRLRLFGATSSKNLPDFDARRVDDDLLEQFQAMTDLEWPNHVGKALQSIPTPEPAGKKAPAAAARTNKALPWYLTQNLPTIDELWPSLRKIGFTKKDGQYWHPQISGAMMGSKALQHCLASRGLPNPTSLTSGEFVELVRWARFGFVEYNQRESAKSFNTLKVLDAAKLRNLLIGKLGFATLDGNLYPPGSDEVARGSKRVHKVHYFRGTEVMAFVQRSKSFYIGLSDDKRAEYDERLDDLKELQSLRLTCALYEDEPLPDFCPDVPHDADDDSEDEVMEEAEDDDHKLIEDHERGSSHGSSIGWMVQNVQSFDAEPLDEEPERVDEATNTDDKNDDTLVKIETNTKDPPVESVGEKDPLLREPTTTTVAETSDDVGHEDDENIAGLCHHNDVPQPFACGLLTQAGSFDVEDDAPADVNNMIVGNDENDPPAIDLSATTSALPPLTQPGQDGIDSYIGDSLARLEPAASSRSSSQGSAVAAPAPNMTFKSPTTSAQARNALSSSASVFHSAKSYLGEPRRRAMHAVASQPYLDSLTNLHGNSPDNNDAFEDAQECGTPSSVKELLESIDDKSSLSPCDI